MPCINRIRVNNVKYNFGTQQYDDFTMRMYGKNTLYDLANGGGKSVLMLLLLQNLIPNCTLDDKQPIEKLFRTGSGNTTIHSLIEWKLDEADIKDGYRYMTTGFCARKAKETEEQSGDEGQTAAIEYFNYCIFYRDYNKNDIVNLPLSDGENRITYSGLKAYLKDLSHRDMALEIKIFDRKGEYQRFISGYGLFESHWEIIRGINKTEGHVRTYFETNYKTTRKVVEDLLIEEIIEKAFATRTGASGDEDEMAKTLLDIKDKLNVLAKKKQDIANYDHQMELINVLLAKVNSCISRYEEHEKITKELSDIYVTGKEFTSKDTGHLDELLALKQDAFDKKENQKKRLECLKITRDNLKLDELKDKISHLNNDLLENEQKIDSLRLDINMKESINDYLGYQKDKRELEENQLIVKNIMDKTGVNREQMAVLAYNRKLRDDKRLAGLFADKEETEASKNNAEARLSECKKYLMTAEVSEAVAKENISEGLGKTEELSKEMSELAAEASLLVAGDVTELKAGAEEKEKSRKERIELLISELEEDRDKLYKAKYNLKICENEFSELEQKQVEVHLNAEEYHASSARLSSIMTIYNAKKPEEAAGIIKERIDAATVSIVKKREEADNLKKREKCLAGGRLFEPTEGVKKVIDYITTRHGYMAMHGADYLAALTPSKREELLLENKELPYGVVVKNFSDLKDDANLENLDTGNELVMIYDMDKLDTDALICGDNAKTVCRDDKYFLDEDILHKLQDEVAREIKDIEDEEISLINEKLLTYREDLDFVSHFADTGYLDADEEEQRLSTRLLNKRDEIKNLEESIKELTGKQKSGEEELHALQEDLKDIEENKILLAKIDEIYGLIKKEESRVSENKERLSTLSEKISEINGDILKWTANINEDTAKLSSISESIKDIQYKWINCFKPYFTEGVECEILDISDEALETEFMAMREIDSKNAPDIEDKKKLINALTQSMDRILRTIKKRGIEIADIKAQENLYEYSEEQLAVLSEELSRLVLVSASVSEEIKKVSAASDRLSGSIEYALLNLKKTYGENAYVSEDISLREAENAIQRGDALLLDLEQNYEKAALSYDTFVREQGYMQELFKDVKRIIETNDIDTSRGIILDLDKETLRKSFEENLLKFDRSRKNLEKTRNELLRFKGQTAEALSEMGVYEMAETIRRDVTIPDNYYEAKSLLENLGQIIDFIRLEKERVEKGILDMVAIKENFCSQCLQRCMDVKTELEKLPKLSKITLGDEVIKMVDLSIPYVKEEFLAQRMSDYIDDVVKGADAIADERKRIRYIRDCLALKKLFGVMVTDMNAIKMKLYKRERIKEQSRYLKYEEAVGSTGQSQGIYIQFLVAIINYISGMYSYGNEETVSTKTIFIDNPFGAAKDVYIWEPIFAMLEANHVQLIVPARGATPAITGRFDVNYVLGQQMVGKRQQTVVIDYTSKTNQEELEYQELSYEQATFDFI